MLLAIIVAAAACVIGWHASMAHMTHRGIPVRRGQLRDYRKDRMRHGLRTVVIGVIFVLILVVIVLH